jgi:hypothetical protein
MVPNPTLLWKVTSPPIVSVKRLTTAKPKPWPLALVVNKGAKVLDFISAGIPFPVSWTQATTCDGFDKIKELQQGTVKPSMRHNSQAVALEQLNIAPFCMGDLDCGVKNFIQQSLLFWSLIKRLLIFCSIFSAANSSAVAKSWLLKTLLLFEEKSLRLPSFSVQPTS